MKSQYPKISIIIPIYNVAPYLDACLSSVAAQTYSNLEIILIDDGSTDNSAAIAKAFAKKYKNTFYFHQTNAGVSAARNTGLKKSTSPLISFIDPDDTVEPTLIEHLYDNLETHQADLASISHKRSASLSSPLDRKSAIKQLLLEQNISFHLWSKLYKRPLFNGIEFPTGHIYEDVAVQLRLFDQCKIIHLDHQPLYHYRIREGSYVSSPTPSQFSDLFRFAESNLAFIRTNYPDLVPYAEKYLWTAARRTLQDLLRTKNPLAKSDELVYLTYLKRCAPSVLKTKESPKSEKLLAALALANKHLPLPLLERQSNKPRPLEYS